MSAMHLDNFVNREEELGHIKDRIIRLARGVRFNPNERIVHFVGPSGIGKTCLLQESQWMAAEDLREKSISMRFDNLSTGNIRRYLIEIDTALLNHIGGPPVRTIEDSPQRINNSILKRLDSHLGERAFVLFIDEVDSLSPDSRKEFESLLFMHLLRNPRTLLVLAGRTIVHWSDFTLAAHPYNTFKLFPFDVDMTRKQLKLKEEHRNLATKIHTLGDGVPGNIARLADHVMGEPPSILDELQAIQSLLSSKKEEVEERFIPILEAICILREFFPEDVVPLVNIHPALGGQWNEASVGELFRELRQVQVGPGGLINWDRDKKSWAIDEPTRALFEKELKMRDPDLWKKLHCTAHWMYKAWGEEFNLQLHRDKAAYHQNCLQSVGMNCDGMEG